MSFSELNMLLVHYRELIANTWNFYVSVHLALFGLIALSRKNIVPYVLKGVMALGYVAFLYINYRAQIDNYQFAGELRHFGMETFRSDPALLNILATNEEAAWINRYLIYIYIASGLASLTVLLFLTGKESREET